MLELLNRIIYRIIRGLIKDDKKAAGVYLNFVQDKNIDNEKSYIVYSNESCIPFYDFRYARAVYQVSIYSEDLEHALLLQRKIDMHFNNLRKKFDDIERNSHRKAGLDTSVSREYQGLEQANIIEICGCEISNEHYEYSEVYNCYQAVSLIAILYKF